MRHARDTSFDALPTQAAQAPRMEASNAYPTPGSVARQIAQIILVCLGLSLLADALVSIVGIY